MKVAVRYYTKSGNTKRLAEAIANAIGVEALDISNPLAENVDVLFLGSSVYAFDVDDNVKKYIVDNASNIAKIANFSTAAMVKSTYKKVKKVAEANNIVMLEEEFHCKGEFKIFNKKRPNDEDLNNASTFAKNILEKYGVK